ncbi:DUF5954 family protein [Streptomyces sp. NBC_00237]|uniref:DUF5954 family protein n=1 Tax=Streptomyces sp. NBC_00237 TaxID=2975687 RepID=UPI00225A934B|nr:DUF5954 family protein [Streptomyces sp. NBC_00237]MCX5206911.1 DUF5954 family protein [Streptomyces sp. NBC_00237]
MEYEQGKNVGQGRRPMVVRVPREPVEAAVEADAVDAMVRAGDVAVRGPLFGVAVQGAEDGPRWRVVRAVVEGCPQQARDGLNSLLWFWAKDEAKDRDERRELLAAVARLEVERVDELTVLGSRYRIIRAEEYAGTGADGIERPRPTDPEPVAADWSREAETAKVDGGLVLDPDAPVTPSQAAEQLALRGLAYTGSRFPAEVLSDALRALETHPDVLLLPAAFRIVQQSDAGWTPAGCLHARAQDARKSLDFSLTYWQPRQRGLIPIDADNLHTDARTCVAAGTAEPGSELAAYAQASDRLRAGRLDQLTVLGAVHRIGRCRRLVRWGPDGPEGPRPSDVNMQDPMRLHPVLTEDGTVLPERAPGDDE